MPIRAFRGVWEDCKGINVKCPWSTKNIRQLFFKVGLLSLPLITDYSKLDIYLQRWIVQEVPFLRTAKGSFATGSLVAMIVCGRDKQNVRLMMRGCRRAVVCSLTYICSPLTPLSACPTRSATTARDSSGIKKED